MHVVRLFSMPSIPPGIKLQYTHPCFTPHITHSTPSTPSTSTTGTCSYSMRDAIVSTADSPLPIPTKWLDFYYETPGDSQGSLLVLVQLIPTLGRIIPPPANAEIEIDTQKATIELILIGIRDLAAYNFQAMSAPFVEIEMNSFGSTYNFVTAPSKRPDPDNPNFLEKIVMPVLLPLHSVFCTPLQV